MGGVKANPSGIANWNSGGRVKQNERVAAALRQQAKDALSPE